MKVYLAHRLLVSVTGALFTSAVLLASLQAGRTTCSTQPQPRRDAHVIVISIDGLVPEYYLEPARRA
jgi:hypothetical protein